MTFTSGPFEVSVHNFTPSDKFWRMEEEEGIRQQVLKSTLNEIETTGGNSKAPDVCVICLDSISERAVASPCRHDSFDFLCLVSWLQERSNCPLCKTEVQCVEYDWKSPEHFEVYKVVPISDLKTARTASYSNRPTNALLNRQRRSRRDWRPQRPRPQAPSSPDAALVRRRYIYQHQLYSLHVGTNRLSMFRDLTPKIFADDQELVSRARKWIRRELQVFEFLNRDGSEEEGITRRANNAEFLLEYIVAILKTVDIKGSGGQAEDMLQEFLGRDNTRLFLHELRSWLRSPYTSVEDWDRHVQYDDISTAAPEHQAQQDSNSYETKDEEQTRGATMSDRSRVRITGRSHQRYERYAYYQRRQMTRSNQHFLSEPGCNARQEQQHFDEGSKLCLKVTEQVQGPGPFEAYYMGLGRPQQQDLEPLQAIS